ncbi:hypothetical protein O6H91_12G063800 [Diphasiastrum complanatum]|uniref:Uncharacterized protein n=1 Tax=Diphasiastrum complanatum TaxID=34168 RepID=A0ACC2C2S9_DIPCM|nr:hypothetical protein O6H91_12G063800 [Diphasiastrum complanatum]
MGAVGTQQRQLVLVVEGTAALGSVWPSLRSEYVDKIVRAFCGYDTTGQKLAGISGTGEMALVVFGSHGSYTGCLLQQSGWTTNLDVFIQWLSSITFAGGGFGEVAIAEGLAEALVMCCPGPSVPPISQGVERQKHCVLVAASNPHRLATPVPRPPLTTFVQQGGGSEVQAEHWWLADADTVAKAFPQCLVSLSVVSPRQLPVLKTVYNGGKRNARATDLSADVLKHPQHLVLLSEGFVEAKNALRRPAAASTTVAPSSIVKIEQQVPTVSSPPPAGQPSMVNPRVSSVSAMAIGGHVRQSISNGTLPTVTVKAEAGSISSLPNVSALSHISSSSLIQSNASAVPLNLQQTAVPAPLSGQDGLHPSLTSDTGNVLGSNSLQPLWTTGPTVGTINSLSNPAQARQLVNSGSLQGASSLSMQSSVTGLSVGAGSNTLTMGQGGLGVSQVGIGATSNSGALGNPIGAGQVATALSNAGFATGTASLGMGQVGLTGSQLGQGGLGVVHGVMGGQGSAGVSTGPGSMIPTPGITQPIPGIQSLGVGNNSMQGLQPLNITSNGAQGVQPLNMGSNSVQAAQALTVGNSAIPVVQPLSVGNSSVQALQTLGVSSSAVQSMQPIGVGNNPIQGMQQIGVGSNVVQGAQPLGVGNNAVQGVQSLNVGNAAAPGSLHVSSAVATPPQQSAGGSAKYTKLWEGILAGTRQQKPVAICKLEGYRQISAPDTLASDWPATMQIVRLIAQDYMNSKDYQGKAELLVFRPLTPHGFLVQLAEKKLCAVIQLPSQTLLLASADKPNRMIGMLFPGDMVVFKPQVPPQQQAQNSTPSLGQNFGQGQLSSQSGQLSAQARSPLMQSTTNLPGSGFLS